jgi:transcriptional regulator with GAF, ATPase, and Fis domain
MGVAVDTDRPDALERLDLTTEALASLRDIFAAEEPLATAVERVAVTASRLIPDAHAVTITRLGRHEPDSVAWTDERYLEIDKHQHAADRGPCLEAARSLRPVRASTNDHREQWPEFSAAAERIGVQAYLSVPLLLEVEGRESELVGALNLYSHTAAAFDPFDEALMRLFSVAATQAISNAARWQQSRDQVRNLEIALASRAEIDQAKGILMAVHRCTAEKAFEKLVELSQRRNVKVRQIAKEFLDSVLQDSS